MMRFSLSRQTLTADVQSNLVSFSAIPLQYSKNKPWNRHGGIYAGQARPQSQYRTADNSS